LSDIRMLRDIPNACKAAIGISFQLILASAIAVATAVAKTR
jgi:hypothetical protein